MKIEQAHLDMAVRKKLEAYSGRHHRSIEAFAQQQNKSSDKVPLYLAYYFIKFLIEQDFELIPKGLKRKTIHDGIKEMHHRGQDVRSSDMSNFLHGIVRNQIKKSIQPPLFDYDQSAKRLRIIDSTMYFFLRESDRKDLRELLEEPQELS